MPKPLRHRTAVVVAVAMGVAVCASATPDAEARASGCPRGMALVDASAPTTTVGASSNMHGASAYCIDRYEASLVEVTANGEKPFSPYEQVKGRKVKAVSRQGVVPQAYISRNEAEAACKQAHKRMCTEDEWMHACQGKNPTTFPYGDDRKAGYCNDNGRPPLATYYASAGDGAFGFEPMNDPRLNELPGTVARTGTHSHCRNSFGVFDMVGNVHEWVADPEGTFRGGYYLDTKINGEGCHYKTVAHDATYHDYSTGFRCCADAR